MDRDLSMNPLTAIPADVRKMSQLTELYVTLRVCLGRITPTHAFPLCRHLNHLDLGEIQPDALPTALTTLDIGNCSLRAIPQALEKLKALTDLYINQHYTLLRFDITAHADVYVDVCAGICP